MKKIITAVISLCMFFGGFTPVIVRAHEGEEHETEKETHSRVEDKIDRARKKIEDRVSELKSNAQQKAKEARTHICEERKENIVNRLENYAEYGKRHKETFDSVLARVDDFVARKNLSTENITSLRTAIDTAEANAITEIEALKELKGSVDCNDPDSVAAGLEGYREQAAAVRDALKAYREAIRTYMQAVKQAAEAQQETETES